ncbi:MAG: phosphoenolpyruvate synthase [Motiliproteus sp.]
MSRYIVGFDQVSAQDYLLVGGKHAPLGEMIAQLADQGVRVPPGFATTAQAYRDFLAFNDLQQQIMQCLNALDVENIGALAAAGDQIREWILQAPLQPQLITQIGAAWTALGGAQIPVAVRASAIAEGLPDASFSGQQQSYLNVSGLDAVIKSIKQVYASLFNDRAIAYRVHRSIPHDEVVLSAGVQRMVHTDTGASGILDTLDRESGFQGVFYLCSVFGLGEPVILGQVSPDEFHVSKSLLDDGRPAIISRNLGTKAIKMIRASEPDAEPAVVVVKTAPEQRCQFSLTDTQVLELARMGAAIEAHFGQPMAIEWALDGEDGRLYVLQAQGMGSVKSSTQRVERYLIKETGRVLLEGRSVGQRIGSGPVRIVNDRSDLARIQAGDVLVADMTDPEWEPVLRRVAGIITNRGGRTCHAAIIARELGIPAIVGCGDATELLRDAQLVTVSCAEGDSGLCYQGKLDFEHQSSRIDAMPPLPFKMMLNVANPDRVFNFASLPNQGIGLARLEFIITRMIGVHPKALLRFSEQPAEVRRSIALRSAGYGSPQTFFVEKLAEGIATLAVACAGKPVIVRMSDFKSNEYRNLIGGRQYELDEENPMLGFRGASRYISDAFRDCFELECQAIVKVRDQLGLTNVELMLPFVRTLGEARQVIELLRINGLRRGVNGLRIIMMCELPANALLADQFLEYFDGFSIGSNDLTQLTLGLDRDSGVVAHLFDERNAAVKVLLKMAIEACHRANKYVGICGQAPSDYPDMARWLMEQGVDSISLDPDSVLDTWFYLTQDATGRS